MINCVLGCVLQTPNQSSNNLDANIIQQLQHLQQLLMKQQDSSARQEADQVKFDKKLLDFDYGSDDDDENAAPSPQPQQSTGLERYEM
jgi:RNA-binding protein 16